MRLVHSLLALSLLSCDGGESGKADVSEDSHAPWSMDGLRTALFVGEIDEDGEYGEAYILLSTEELDCDDMEDDDFEELFYGSSDAGTGLLIVLRYDDDDDSLDDDASAFEGLYLGGYSYSYEEEVSRASMIAAFNDGYLYLIGGYYGGGSWVRIDDAGEEGDHVKGEFYTTFWWGDFSATNCEMDVRESRSYDSWY